MLFCRLYIQWDDLRRAGAGQQSYYYGKRLHNPAIAGGCYTVPVYIYMLMHLYLSRRVVFRAFVVEAGCSAVAGMSVGLLADGGWGMLQVSVSSCWVTWFGCWSLQVYCTVYIHVYWYSRALTYSSPLKYSDTVACCCKPLPAFIKLLATVQLIL